MDLPDIFACQFHGIDSNSGLAVALMRKRDLLLSSLLKIDISNESLEIKCYIITIRYFMQIYIHNKYMIFNLNLYD